MQIFLLILDVGKWWQSIRHFSKHRFKKKNMSISGLEVKLEPKTRQMAQF